MLNNNSKLETKNDILLKRLSDYFWNNKRVNIMISIINGNSNISLRILDWFVTNYSKKHNIVYNIVNKNNEIKLFKVYLQYKMQLKSYNKKLFDPFCRRSRIRLKYNKDSILITTLGQLNFFKWSIENNIIEYVKNNFDKIENDMILSKKNKCKEKDIYKKVVKLNEINETITISAINTSDKKNDKILLCFE